MRFIATERAVDICATSHEIERLADVSACHKHLPVAFGIGVGVDHIITIKLLRHCIGMVAPRLHHESVGEQPATCVLV